MKKVVLLFILGIFLIASSAMVLGDRTWDAQQLPNEPSGSGKNFVFCEPGGTVVRCWSRNPPNDENNESSISVGPNESVTNVSREGKRATPIDGSGNYEPYSHFYQCRFDIIKKNDTSGEIRKGKLIFNLSMNLGIISMAINQEGSSYNTADYDVGDQAADAMYLGPNQYLDVNALVFLSKTGGSDIFSITTFNGDPGGTQSGTVDLLDTQIGCSPGGMDSFTADRVRIGPSDDGGITREIYASASCNDASGKDVQFCKLIVTMSDYSPTLSSCVDIGSLTGLSASWLNWHDFSYDPTYDVVYFAVASGSSMTNTDLTVFILDPDTMDIAAFTTPNSVSPPFGYTAWREVAVDLSEETFVVAGQLFDETPGEYGIYDYGWSTADDLATLSWSHNPNPGALVVTEKQNQMGIYIFESSPKEVETLYETESLTADGSITIDYYTEAPVPEFSTWALMLALVVVISGFAAMKFKGRI